MRENESYIIQCRTNWFLGIRPASINSKELKEYKALIKIAKTYFDNNLYDEFAMNFMESQYLIPLWTAHLILEYGKPNGDLKQKCLQIIRIYSDNPLAPEASIEEKIWLDNNKNF
jgi:hypothetical protein